MAFLCRSEDGQLGPAVSTCRTHAIPHCYSLQITSSFPPHRHVWLIIWRVRTPERAHLHKRGPDLLRHLPRVRTAIHRQRYLLGQQRSPAGAMLPSTRVHMCVLSHRKELGVYSFTSADLPFYGHRVDPISAQLCIPIFLAHAHAL